jgi:hypothetical protein
MLRQQLLRSSRAIVRPSLAGTQAQQVRKAHAISNPTLANIEKRWESMPPQEQADLWMALRDRMKANWAELTVQEKKAGKWMRNPQNPQRVHHSSSPISFNTDRQDHRQSAAGMALLNLVNHTPHLDL